MSTTLQICAWRLCAKIFVLLILAPTLVCATTPRERFEAEYPAAAVRLEEFYSRMRISATQSTSFPSTGETWRNTIEYVLAGRSMKLMATRANRIGPRAEGYVEALVAHPPLSFMLHRDPENPRFAVDWLGTGHEVGYGEVEREIVQSLDLIRSPYCLGDHRLVDLMKTPQFTISAIAEEPAGGGNLLRVEFQAEVDDVPEGPVPMEGVVTVDPARAWVIRSFREKAKAPSVAWGEGTVAYDGAVDGIPLLKSCTIRWGTKNEVGTERTLNVGECVPGAVPESEFTLAAFGITGPAGAGRINSFTYWSIVIATVALLVTVVLRVVRARLARGTTP